MGRRGTSAARSVLRCVVSVTPVQHPTKRNVHGQAVSDERRRRCPTGGGFDVAAGRRGLLDDVLAGFYGLFSGADGHDRVPRLVERRDRNKVQGLQIWRAQRRGDHQPNRGPEDRDRDVPRRQDREPVRPRRPRPSFVAREESRQETLPTQRRRRQRRSGHDHVYALQAPVRAHARARRLPLFKVLHGHRPRSPRRHQLQDASPPLR
mmetsp:Transcript_13288/g.40192  ORF Transcript_13288/g.40192 Transcript_13288/m.40192 type:complete len:207 (+) Transcript_13288:98-718(+)